MTPRRLVQWDKGQFLATEAKARQAASLPLGAAPEEAQRLWRVGKGREKAGVGILGHKDRRHVAASLVGEGYQAPRPDDPNLLLNMGAARLDIIPGVRPRITGTSEAKDRVREVRTAAAEEVNEVSLEVARTNLCSTPASSSPPEPPLTSAIYSSQGFA